MYRDGDAGGVCHCEGEPRVLWAGVLPCPPLSALHDAVGTAVAAVVDLRAEGRPWTPHITLAYLNGVPPACWADDFLRRHAGFSVPRVLVSRFALFLSLLTQDGPQYRIEATFDLATP